MNLNNVWTEFEFEHCLNIVWTLFEQSLNKSSILCSNFVRAHILKEHPIIIFPPARSILECYVTGSHFARLTYSSSREVETELKLDFGDGFSGKKKKRGDSWEAVEEGEVGAQFFFIFTSPVFGRRKEGSKLTTIPKSQRPHSRIICSGHARRQPRISPNIT